MLLLCCWAGLAATGAIAQGTEPPELEAMAELKPAAEPLDLTLLKPGHTPPSVVTATTISETGLTIPSLWWIWEQYAARERFGNKLMENWIAHPPDQVTQPGRIDLVVNRQLWSSLDYLERYSFIHKFGSVGKDYGYNTRVFDNRANFLGAYTCDFSARPVAAPGQSRAQFARVLANAPSVKYSPFVQPDQTQNCATLLDYNGSSSLRGRPTGGGASIFPGSP